MLDADWLILRILHQSFEVERPKGHCQSSWYIYSSVYTHVSCFDKQVLDLYVKTARLNNLLENLFLKDVTNGECFF